MRAVGEGDGLDAEIEARAAIATVEAERRGVGDRRAVLRELGALGIAEARVDRRARRLRRHGRGRAPSSGDGTAGRVVVEIEVGRLGGERGALRQAGARSGWVTRASATVSSAKRARPPRGEVGGRRERGALADEDAEAEAFLARVGQLLDLAETHAGGEGRLLDESPRRARRWRPRGSAKSRTRLQGGAQLLGPQRAGGSRVTPACRRR